MSYTKDNYVWGLLRLALGWTFLWAFLDKLFGWGFATAPEAAWLAGGSPTTGFLSFATKGPFAGLYQSLAGSAVVDWMFMLGLLLIGAALLLGVGVKVAGYAGALLMVLMYTAGSMPLEHNPFLDEHVIYAVLLIGFTFVPSGQWLGFGSQWSKTKLVQTHPWLQ
jgi:thiosulfate dehydrogenase (quinone) large subunit